MSRAVAWLAVAVAAAVAAVGCTSAPRTPRTPLVDATPLDTGDDGGARLRRELELEVLAGYDRYTLDAASAAAAIDPSIGLTSIGVGPEEQGPSGAPLARWPVTVVDDGQRDDLGRTDHPVEVVSRALELHLSDDRTVGWTFDQVSLHLRVCKRVATIPLRVAQVYVRDSERWTLVSEHVGYAQSMGRWLDEATGPTGAAPAGAVEDQPAAREAAEALAASFALDADRAARWDGAVDALAVWPDPLHVLRGGATRTGPSLAASVGATELALEGTRLALAPGGHVAIAATSVLARVDRADGPIAVRLRATAVLERGAAWKVRMAMVSTPISLAALVRRTLGVVATTVNGNRVTASCAGPGAVALAP